MIKKTLFSLTLMVHSWALFAQSSILTDGRLTIDSLYEKADEQLISQFIFEFPELKKEELMKRTKNWGSTRFVNMKEVLVGETEDQFVFNYIDKSVYVKTMGMTSRIDWYIRLVVQFKDGKFRAQYFDDGNAFQPGSQYGPSMKARQYKLENYFKNDDGVKVAQKSITSGMVALKESIKKNANDLESSIRGNTSKKDDW